MGSFSFCLRNIEYSYWELITSPSKVVVVVHFEVILQILNQTFCLYVTAKKSITPPIFIKNKNLFVKEKADF